MPQTRTRKTSTRKRSGTKDNRAAPTAAQRKATAEAAAAKKATQQANAAKAREAAKVKRTEEATKARKALVKSGALIEDGDAEFHVVERDGDTPAVEERAGEVLKRLQKSKTPVLGRDLMNELGGGWPQYLSFFSLLKQQGLVREYRKRTGERGGSGVAYLWIG